MTQPKVSVIIPVYNTEKYLRECLDSVINQTLTDIEIICVDDGSTDSSPEILAEYAKKDDRFKILRQQNLYAGVARNHGLTHAAGKYVFFMDSDDFCSPTLLEKTVTKADSLNADIVVFSHHLLDSESGKQRTARISVKNIAANGQETFSYKDAPHRIMSVISPVPWNKLFGRKFLLEHNLRFDALSSTNDISFGALSLAAASKIAYIEEPLLTYRQNVAGSISSTKPNKLNNVLKAVNSVCSQAAQLPHYDEIKDSVRFFAADNLYFALNHYAGEVGTEKHNGFLREAGIFFFCSPLFFNISKESLRNNNLYSFISNALAAAEEVDRFPNAVISLTSYPKRINTVHLTIQSLLNQSVKPSLIVLWLAESEFPFKEKDLPDSLLNLCSHEFQIRWTDNIKSYKKLIPALEAFPNSIIITVDDDLVFDADIVKRLLIGYREKPNCIQCHRVTTIDYSSINDIKVTPDAKKIYDFPTYLHKLSGGAGCLYPPHCLHSDVSREDLFLSLAPTSDDIWFWLMGALNGYKVNVVKNNIPRLTYIPSTQDEALWKINDHGDNLFFVHLKNILRYYPVLQELLLFEQQRANKNISQSKSSPYSNKINPEFDSQKKQLADYKARLNIANREIWNIHNSWTYRIGRFITWLPRKVRGFVRCYREHGAYYTYERVLVHLHLKPDPYKAKPAAQKKKPPVKAESAPSPKAPDSQKQTVISAPSAPVKRDYDYYSSLSPNEYERALAEWFERTTGEKADFDSPKTFNQKIQWLKLYDSTPIKTRLADKYLVREWVKEKIGEQYLVPLLGVWDSFDEINFDELPDQFALKANHGSGWNIIVSDKSKFDIQSAKQKFDLWMSKNFAFIFGLELHYLNISKKIIAEKYIADLTGDIFDYRFFCFNGEPKYVWVDIGSGTKNHKRNVYDLNWNPQGIYVNYPTIEPAPGKPGTFSEMLACSQKMCAGFSFVRIDFYSVNGKVYFGEMTFTPQSGTGKWSPPEYNRIFGDLITLPEKSPYPERKN